MQKLLLLGVLALACNEKNPAGEAQASEHQKDFIKLEPGSPRLDFIKIEPVRESDAASVVSLTGRVTFDEDHTQRVASPIDGRVLRLLVSPGDKVRAGQSLVELSSPQVGQLQADALKAQHDFEVAQKTIDRVHKLQSDGAVSDKEVAQAEAEFKKSRADVGRTAAQLRALGISASDPAVRVSLHAQIAGTVVERSALVGQEVRADQAQALMTITSLDVVWVQADVYEQDLALLQPGAQVTVHVPAYPGESFAGKIVHIGDVVDAQTRTVKLRCVAPNPEHKLKPEMFAKVELKDVSGRKLVVIPARAVLSDGQKTKVVVATEGNVFKVREIEVGPEVDGVVRVLAKLRPGEKIVTDGALFLKHEIEDL
ncbi:MAG TPA: efflux RND transporter periplasmic adaptor subunit [Polyangia bacterium]|nr:efflux RND transporter periplasmic adaptor subunit [Polyangia bacterium]